MTSAGRDLPVVGWREWVRAPELSPVPIKAKVDTGARTSALHAADLEIDACRETGTSVARFIVHPHQRSADEARRVEFDIVEFRTVRSSNGQEEARPVVRTVVELGPYAFEVEFTLTRRDDMGFRMLLGRTAVGKRFLVDPARSYRCTSDVVGSNREEQR